MILIIEDLSPFFHLLLFFSAIAQNIQLDYLNMYHKQEHNTISTTVPSNKKIIINYQIK